MGNYNFEIKFWEANRFTSALYDEKSIEEMEDCIDENFRPGIIRETYFDDALTIQTVSKQVDFDVKKEVGGWTFRIEVAAEFANPEQLDLKQAVAMLQDAMPKFLQKVTEIVNEDWAMFLLPEDGMFSYEKPDSFAIWTKQGKNPTEIWKAIEWLTFDGVGNDFYLSIFDFISEEYPKLKETQAD